VVLPRWGERWAFAVVVVASVALVAPTAVPSPFYPLYAERFGLPPVATSVVFAVYVVGVVALLVTVGRLSDHIGRRPLLLAACGISLVALALLATARGFPELLTARLLQGVSVGISNATLAAALVDFAPAGDTRSASVLAGALPPASLALGVLLAGGAITAAAEPSAVAYATSGAVVLTACALLIFLPERYPRRPGALASLRPRLGVPRAARDAFLAVAGGLVSGWAFAGLFLALMPAVLGAAWPSASPLARALPLAAFLALAASACALLGIPESRALAIALYALGIGGIGVAIALMTPGVSPRALLPAAAIAGFGFGGTFQSALRHLVAVTGTVDRAGVIAVALSTAFASFGVPSILAGALAPLAGVLPAAVGYAAATVACTASSLIAIRGFRHTGGPARFAPRLIPGKERS
jgi:MFS family permease